MKKKLLAMAFSLTFSCLTVADSTSQVDRSFPTEDTPAALEALWAETNARLHLSDEQAEKVAPILHSSFESQRAVLLEYGIDIESGKPPAKKLGYQKARAMGRDLEAVRADTNDALENILTEEQMREYQSMQNERRNEMRKRMRAAH